MKNVFIIHGSFGDSKEHYLPWLKEQLEVRGGGEINVISPDFPIGENKQSFESWSKVLDKYKDKIDKNTVFVARSIGPIFVLKYLIKNNLKIKALYSISGFNCFGDDMLYNKVNKSFFLDEIKDVKKHIKKCVCFISKNDPYVPYYLLDMFCKNLRAKVVMRESAGHYNTDSGYTKFEELLNMICK